MKKAEIVLKNNEKVITKIIKNKQLKEREFINESLKKAIVFLKKNNGFRFIEIKFIK